jgi:hypothetical protein
LKCGGATALAYISTEPQTAKELFAHVETFLVSMGGSLPNFDPY